MVLPFDLVDFNLMPTTATISAGVFHARGISRSAKKSRGDNRGIEDKGLSTLRSNDRDPQILSQPILVPVPSYVDPNASSGEIFIGPRSPGMHPPSVFRTEHETMLSVQYSRKHL